MDMYDKEIIKDMKFPFCRFENDSSGKSMLNILFALAKQYSEHISEGVLRANDNRLPEGKSSGARKSTIFDWLATIIADFMVGC